MSVKRWLKDVIDIDVDKDTPAEIDRKIEAHKEWRKKIFGIGDYLMQTSDKKDKTGARKASTAIALDTTAAIMERMKDIIAYEPHPNKPGEFQLNKPYVKLPFNMNAEGFEDVDEDEILVAFPEVKLLHAQSQPVEDAIDGARAGIYWHMSNVKQLPDNLDVVGVHTFTVKYPPNDGNPDGSTQKFIVFTTLDFLRSYPDWIGRALDPDDLDLSRDMVSNMFVIGFQSTGLKQYKQFMTDSMNSGAAYATGYRLGVKDRANIKGKWKNVVLTPSAQLDDAERLIGRSLKELAREIHDKMEAYYAKRREEMGIEGPYVPDPEAGANTDDI